MNQKPKTWERGFRNLKFPLKFIQSQKGIKNFLSNFNRIEIIFIIYIAGEFVGKDLGFVIDHEASGLTPPDPSVVLGRNEFNSSQSMLDAAPVSWGPWANQVFIAEWGDLAPPTNPLRGGAPAGFQVVRVDPASGELSPFATKINDRPASYLGMPGRGPMFV